MSYQRQTMRNMLLTTLSIATLLALPPVRASSPQTSGNTAPTTSGVTVIRFGKLWDGSKVITDAVVVVDGERVKSVGSGSSAVPPGAHVGLKHPRVWGVDIVS